MEVILKMPLHWKQIPIRDIRDKTDRYSYTGGPFGSNLKSSDYTSSGIRIIQLQNIGDGDFLNEYKIFTSTEKADELSNCNIFPNDIIISKMADPLARACLIPSFHNRYVMCSDGIRLSVDKNKFDNRFIYYAINSAYFRKSAELSGTGTTRLRIGLDELRNLPIAVPPLSEQYKIAEILSSVDTVIENNESLVNKLTDLKKALMQELFTKGIGHTEFKDSPLGKFPKEWEVTLCNDVAKMGTGHTPSKSFSKYYNGEIKWVSLADSNKLDNVYIDNTKYEISSLGIQNSSAVLHPAGTLLISRDAGVGKSAIMAIDMAVSQHFITYTCSNKLNNLFLYYLFQNRKHEFERIAIGSTIKTIGLPYFKSLMIPLPSISEQEQISKTLLSIDKRIWSCESKLTSISNLKQALMQDLLTGKVRVKTT